MELEPPAGTDADAAGPLALGLRALRTRSACMARIAPALRAAENDGTLSCGLAELAQSFLHMHAVRLLASAPRAQELVLHDFLHRLYDGRLARTRETRAR